MPGPLPKPEAQRRNRTKPRIPTTSLPSTGCTEPTPDPPEWVKLATAGQTWWEWAWHTPQAAGWSPEAHLDTVAHRAALEDDLAAIETEDFAGLDDEELRELVRVLKGMVTGKSTVLTRIKDYDDRLGLSPQSMAKMRWTIVDTEEKTEAEDSTGGKVVQIDSRWQRTGS